MTTDMPRLSKYCSLYFHALHEMALHIAGGFSVVRYVYERWTAACVPSTVASVLFICTANVCRSPLAAAYFALLVQNGRRLIAARSAGLETNPGKPAHSISKIVAGRQHLSLDAHVTTQLNSELVDQCDLIVVMEISQKDRIHRLYPKAKGKTVLLGSFDSSGPLEIRDPKGRSIEEFQFCLEQIMRCCNSLSQRLGLREGV
jgi:protein-tyrosine phosphatase